jgi:anti-sigma-K factor RskA
MELKEFIATGIIESYLLGTASQQEVDMVHSMLSKYPSLQTEIDAVEDALLKMAEENAPEINAGLKEKILSSLEFNKPKAANHHFSTKENGKVVQMQVSNKKLALKYGFAAAVGLFIISMVINILLFNSNRQMASEVSKMGTEKTEMQQSIAGYMEIVDKLNNDFDIITKNTSVQLKGTDVSPKSLATVYWNEQSNEVYLYVKDLPPPPSDMQYQLWAIVDGKPVDAGVFDTGKGNILQNMKSAAAPQAFAVTLEKKGGSPVPTLEAMYLIGEV